ncbi:MAG: cytochrome-c peroxidase [Candidatus Thiodiazotropha sp. (ex Lucinoma borealis)]|nr:cytochrome-c peroxidase [Candidatus Thiodiazotropha sp. (ex Lucinoma borealis)]MCU7863974.1 cytochrome-c peroxidase [Candidatus Thiodiazotropha sp. (ex Lucinoma borealis)]MCU7870529.1 cytochrome-c peroxidase [Candidatus Thiodiazotropha sp. (ex Lucinoma borealis)]MCU7948246.1 cytochrome-c peroxidase [Candidatus Thiodiazotropha sp. (ex Cardiolucina cf. quadrata)]
MRNMKLLTLFCALSTGSVTAIGQQWQALPETAPAPADNPTTSEKVVLGKMLFFDPRLSSNGTVSCFSCHNVMEGGDDHRTTSIGVHGQAGGRNAPTVWNAAYHSVQFWDGRADSLEDQAKGPPANPIEMGMTNLDAVSDRITLIPGYKPYFDQAFGEGENINIENIAKAIAAYERTLVTPNSPFDRYLRGDKKALSKQAIQGMETFAATGCISCHSGANFNGPSLPTGQGFFQKFPMFTNNEYVTKYGLMNDTGRMNVTGNETDKNLWRVPTLRNLTYTAPYMHTGAVKTLDEAVRVMAKTQLDKSLSNQAVEEILAFLDALNGEFPEQTMPRLPATPGNLLD